MELNEDYCMGCGRCCFLGLHRKNTNYKGIEIGDDGWCIHYDPEKKCTIHKKRPKVCRNYKIGSDKCWMFIDFTDDWIEQGIYIPKTIN